MKVAIVTGASSGMGRETILQLADRFGALDEIWAVARRTERLEELKTQVPVRLRSIPLDLEQPESWEALKKLLEQHRPDVKFLVNSAGYGKMGAVGSLELKDETGMPALNCMALCAVTNLVLPYLSKNSRIIQYASAASFVPQPGFAIYGATKSFVLSYSRALNMELRPRGIFVTAVCPGPVRTEFFDVAESTGRKVPLYKRLTMADPRKVVALALRDSMMGKSVSVYGGLMKAFRLLTRILPHDMILNIMTQINGREGI